MPEQRSQILHQIIGRVVGEELHLGGDRDQFPVTLVFWEPKQRIIADEGPRHLQNLSRAVG